MATALELNLRRLNAQTANVSSVVPTEEEEVPRAFEDNDPQNPRNWNKSFRWISTILLSCFTLIGPMSSSMVAPALDTIQQDLGISSAFQKQLVLAIFVLFYGIGTLIFGPLSELYGRVPTLQAGNCIYLAFNTAGGAARTPSQMLAFRALSGLAAGAPNAIGAAVIADLFRPEERGLAVALYNMAPLMGPSLGPLLGAFVGHYLSWHWIFYIMSIADGTVLVLGLLLIRETYAPILLSRRHASSTGTSAIPKKPAHVTRALAQCLWRPMRMLLTQPLIQVLAFFVSYLYGTMYLVLSTFPTLWVKKYHESTAIGGLNYLALGLGYMLGSQVCAFSMDKVYRRLTARNNSMGRPEYKLPLAVFSSALVPIGLLIYAWSAQYGVFWLVPDLGAVLFAMGVIIGLQCVTNYIIDTYTGHAASAVGAISLLRGFAGFGFPLFAPYMYDKLDYGWGNSLLAFIATLGMGAPVGLWVFGQSLRKHSTFCVG